ncbi:hypothetical protein PGT21_028039 [Puccinia graminis f. sp. tritici]|uniref:Uncharacterized protein n=1 Tax=Puccinia graminis f. sp. tritici TaxID=56615 RepID=A0A5B0Q4G4_PUCGR|nr:hypothetical protein PGT21_028039 [Puccinia graminis f. sp. tritici]KAA1108101.1 hypothetical protein PGTUg99_030285 [Puccinia graminis f. sp. tritici]
MRFVRAAALLQILPGVSFATDWAANHAACSVGSGLTLSNGSCPQHGTIPNAYLTRFCYGCLQDQVEQVNSCARCSPIDLNIQHGAHCGSRHLFINTFDSSQLCPKCNTQMFNLRVDCASCRAYHHSTVRQCVSCLRHAREPMVPRSYQPLDSPSYTFRD